MTVLSEFQSNETTIFVNLGLVALYGSYTVLATKGVSSMLSITLYQMLRYWITHILLFVLIASAVMQIKYLNRALQRFDSTTVIPTQFVLFTISAIVGSAVIYKDFDQVDPALLVSFILSCVTEFFGVYLITTNRRIISLDSDDAGESIDDDKSINSTHEEGEINERSPLLLGEHHLKNDSLLQQIPSTSSIRVLLKRKSIIFRGISFSSQLAETDDDTTSH